MSILSDSTFNTAVSELGIETEMGKEALKLALMNVATLDSKQRDYGSGNISDFGEFGVLVRCNDKVRRLQNLLKSSRISANEPIVDSWMDLANYGLIGALVHRGIWK